MQDLIDLDELYIKTYKLIRSFALYYQKDDREIVTLLFDAIKLQANLEIVYYRLANNYMTKEDLYKFYLHHIKPFNYILKIDILKLAKKKPVLSLNNYLKLFNNITDKQVNPKILINLDIINYTKNMSLISNIPEIIQKYGK